MLRLFSVLFLVTLSTTCGQDCNICGEGNQINFPTGVVQFFYDGEVRKNNCNTWQNIVKNPNAISDSFCKNELLEFTHKVCRCTDRFGNSVEWEPPTATPTSAPTPEAGPLLIAANEEGSGDSASTSASGAAQVLVSLMGSLFLAAYSCA